MAGGQKTGGDVGEPGSRGPRANDPYAQYSPANPQPPGRKRCIDCRGVFSEEEMVSDQSARWRCEACVAKLLGTG